MDLTISGSDPFPRRYLLRTVGFNSTIEMSSCRVVVLRIDMDEVKMARVVGAENGIRPLLLY